MKLSAAYGNGKFGLSFELFPPKTEQGIANLFQHVARLVEFRPSFITCTYGAGGSTQSTTLEIVARVHREFRLPVATHLTCVGRTVGELREYLQSATCGRYRKRGRLARRSTARRHRVSARGGRIAVWERIGRLDPSGVPGVWCSRRRIPGNPSGSASSEADLTNLKRKVDAGADVVITQLFYDNADFFRFRDRCAAAGIRVPIVPGVMPVTDFAKIKRFTSGCGESCRPKW